MVKIELMDKELIELAGIYSSVSFGVVEDSVELSRRRCELIQSLLDKLNSSEVNHE
jgi:hypothetical protein